MFVKRVVLYASLSLVLWLLYIVTFRCTTSLLPTILFPPVHPPRWVNWIYEFYPRLHVEKWRFNESFFLAKLHQLLLRITSSIQCLLLYGMLYPTLSPLFKKTQQHLFGVVIRRRYIPYITVLLYSSLLLVIYNAIVEFQDLFLFRTFYTPIGIGKLLLPAFPSLTVLWLLYVGLLASIAAVIFLPHKWISGSLAALGFLYYQLILFGFGKYDHGFSTLTYALLVYPFFLWEASKKPSDETVSAWGIVLIQCLICLAYFYSAVEKIFTSGIAWFYSDNLQQYLLLHHTKWGLLLAQHAQLCMLLSFCVVLLQCSFIGILFFNRLKYILLPAGFVFHTAAWLLLDAGGWFNPWWAMYLFFLFPLQPLETK